MAIVLGIVFGVGVALFLVLKTKKEEQLKVIPVTTSAQITPVVERTGAGDAFGSGVLAALIHGKTLEEALLWGTSNSSSVIGYTGSQKGLLKLEEMDAWLTRAKSSGVEVTQF